MSISRRSFFGLMGASIVATPALAELLTPKRAIFLPPKGGWHPNSLLTASMIREEALRVLSVNMEFMVYMIPRMYDADFDRTMKAAVINIRKPTAYDIRVGDRLTIEGVTRA